MERRLKVIERGEAEPLAIGSHTRILAPASLLDGAYCVFDQLLAPRQISPAHFHDREDQAVCVITGKMVVWVDGDQREVGPGGFALRPAGLPHAMWNLTDEPARFLEITSPAARFEGYMRALSEMIERGESSPAQVAELAGQNGITFLPELTEQLVADTALSTEGAFWRSDEPE